VDHQVRHLLEHSLVNDMDLMKLVHHLYEVDSFHFQFRYLHLQDVHRQDVLQNLVEQNRDEHLPYRHVVHQLNLLVVEVGEERCHLLKMDYYQDAVDVVLPLLMKMDYFLDVVHQV
jgi:hypothetical protein